MIGGRRKGRLSLVVTILVHCFLLYIPILELKHLLLRNFTVRGVTREQLNFG
jgi:hypothetical protein